MSRRLSLSQKRRYLQLLVERDGGFKCFYCKKDLSFKTAVFDHLNDNWRDSSLDNLVLSCQSCNVKKATNSAMKDFALGKQEKNENGMFVGEKFLERLGANTQRTEEASKEIDINVTNFDITEQYLRETIERDGSVVYSDALHSCVYLCREKTGHGSQQSVRNYLATLTSPVAPLEFSKNDDGKKIIVKRNRNIMTTYSKDSVRNRSILERHI